MQSPTRKRVSPMHLSCCIWALRGPEEDNLKRMAELGFGWIDIQPQMLATAEVQAQAKALGLAVSCVGVSFGMPEGAALDSPSAEARAAALAHMDRALAHAASVGASAAYVIPGLDGRADALRRYADSVAIAAERAQTHGLTLGIEHFPGRALDTAAATLEFVRSVGHPNLYLLFDSGHIQMRNEDPAEIIRRAGVQLSYVHLDDNDSQGDLHWALLDGVMTEDSLRRIFAAL
ncbi:MAG: sugar phosphate isomerase/epimerase, partial [Chloroflexi bacterium]|nr:sugar phosphate isomerase/epimerase [Chloroflexota bacterium]